MAHYQLVFAELSKAKQTSINFPSNGSGAPLIKGFSVLNMLSKLPPGVCWGGGGGGGGQQSC